MSCLLLKKGRNSICQLAGSAGKCSLSCVLRNNNQKATYPRICTANLPFSYHFIFDDKMSSCVWKLWLLIVSDGIPNVIEQYLFGEPKMILTSAIRVIEIRCIVWKETWVRTEAIEENIENKNPKWHFRHKQTAKACSCEFIGITANLEFYFLSLCGVLVIIWGSQLKPQNLICRSSSFAFLFNDSHRNQHSWYAVNGLFILTFCFITAFQIENDES